MRAPIAAAVALLAVPAAAQAAYAPQPTLSLAPTAPGVPAAVTASVVQAGGESATKSVTAHFPPAFWFNPGFRVTGCAPADEQASRCPESSRIGRVTATTPFGRFAGGLHLTTDYRFVAALRIFGDLAVSAAGVLRASRDGYEIEFANLPNVPATRLEIALEGGERSLLLTPRACGRYEAALQFASHSGEQRRVAVPIAIAGCRAALRVSRVRVVPRRARRGRAVTLRWRVSEPVRHTEVTVLRRARAEWRTVATRRARSTRLRYVPRVRGRYRLQLRAQAADGRRSRATAVALRVR